MCKESGCLNSKVRWLALQNSGWCGKQGKHWWLDSNLGHKAYISDKSAAAFNKDVPACLFEIRMGQLVIYLKPFSNKGWNGRVSVFTF